tara:strand:+ start:276 stop:884 length:609 start_codon:yes stop_codon:yes gene_type:complete
MTQKIANEVITAEANTLELEGKALAAMWKSICKADKGRFTAATKADGFDTRLGKLMQKLKAEGGERISSDRLKDCGINGIDKRRRSEALWFVENETACRDFVQASKKGFSSLTALQAAMKPKAPVEPKAEAPVEPKADDKSKVGLDSEADKPAVKVEADDIAVAVLDMMQKHNVSLEDFEKAFDAIKVILQDEDTNKAKAVA